MTQDHEGTLIKVRDALLNAQATMKYLSRPPLIKVDEAIADLDRFLADVPPALHDEKLRKGDYWYHECVTLLNAATKRKETKND